MLQGAVPLISPTPYHPRFSKLVSVLRLSHRLHGRSIAPVLVYILQAPAVRVPIKQRFTK